MIDFSKMNADQLRGAIQLLEYLISITPCSGKAKEQALLTVAQNALTALTPAKP